MSTTNHHAAADAARAETLARLLREMDKEKAGEVRLFDDTRGVLDVEAIPTGAVSLDVATGIGGLPLGRMVEIYGPEMGGKTSLALSVAASAQRHRDGFIGFIDAEHALLDQHVRDMGVDTGRLVINQPDNGEEGIANCERMITSGAFDVVIIDSVAAMLPREMIEGAIDESGPMAAQAKLMARFMPRVVPLADVHNVMLILINQLRSKPGVSYGPSDYTPGGRAIPFYASVRLELSGVPKSRQIATGKVVTGQHVTVKVKKNKVGPPFREAEYDLIFGQGIDPVSSLLEPAVRLGVITVTGRTHTVTTTGEVLGTTQDAVRQVLRENEELRQRITDDVYATLRRPRAPEEVPEAAPEEDPATDSDEAA